MKKVVIYGSGQVAEVMYYYMVTEGRRNVAAFCVDLEFRTTNQIFGLPVVDFEEIEKNYPQKDHEILVAASFKRVNQTRTTMVQKAREKGYQLASFASPKAMIWNDFILQPNTFIMENNVVQPYVTIGENVVIWSGNHIGHHTKIGNNCFVASHAVISGGVIIDDFTFIGVNATVRDNVKIGRSCVLGASSLVLSDLPDESVLIGSATPISKVPSSRLRSI